VIWPIYVLKIDYNTVKIKTLHMTSKILRHRKYVIKMTSQYFFPFLSPSLTKSW